MSILGMFVVSAASSSHLAVSHSHQAGDSHDAGDGDASGDIADPEPAKKHTHKHNPADHTHDIPLRSVSIDYVFASTAGWKSRPAADFHSTALLPLERPPKRLVVS